jgi:hypothetical protein
VTVPPNSRETNLIRTCRGWRYRGKSANRRVAGSNLEREKRTKEVVAERVESNAPSRSRRHPQETAHPVPSRPDLEMGAADYFIRLGHDKQRRLSHV